jgi:hypothetical protein
MRVRVEPAAAKEWLQAEIEALGGGVKTVGELLELSFPPEPLSEPGQQLLELTFFVRAWVWGRPGVVAEVVAA